MLRDFQSWWLEQLTELVPERLRQWLISAPDALLVEIERGRLTLSVRAKGKTEVLDRFESGPKGVAALRYRLVQGVGRKLGLVIRISPELTLSKTVTMPFAARSSLEQALAFEMGRETPFEESEVLWDYDILHQDRTTARLLVELVLVPHATVDGLLDGLRASGLAVEVIEASRGERVYRMAVTKTAHRGAHAGRRLMAAAMGGVGILALLALSLPFLRQEQQFWQLESAIGKVRGQAEAVLAMRREIDQLSKSATFLADARVRNVNPLDVLAATTQAIPDDSYLTEFVLRDNRLTIVGSSPSAADLIGRLAATKPFRDPSFAAPVTRLDGGKLELFTISASVSAQAR